VEFAIHRSNQALYGDFVSKVEEYILVRDLETSLVNLRQYMTDASLTQDDGVISGEASEAKRIALEDLTRLSEMDSLSDPIAVARSNSSDLYLKTLSRTTAVQLIVGILFVLIIGKVILSPLNTTFRSLDELTSREGEFSEASQDILKSIGTLRDTSTVVRNTSQEMEVGVGESLESILNHIAKVDTRYGKFILEAGGTPV